MSVLDYQKSPYEAVKDMADKYAEMAANNRAHAASILKLADENDAKHRIWLRSAEALRPAP